MKHDFLASLRCPDCDSDFEFDTVYTRNQIDILNAIVRCRCSEYPVLNGILMYKKPSFQAHMANTGYIISRMRMGRTAEAAALPVKASDRERVLLDMHTFLTSVAGHRRSFNPILNRIRGNRRRTLGRIASSLSFFQAMDILEPNTWGDYLKHRFSANTFWSCYPFIPLIESKNDRVLDMGCGAGHLSFVLSKHMKPEKLVCADENYTLLLLAKRFMAPRAEFVCLDANNPLPFKDGIFSSEVMMDSFHYISNRNLLAGELVRMLSDSGLMLQLHLHNVLRDNQSPGYAMKPESWKGLFADSNPRIMPEDSIVKDFIYRGEAHLGKEYSTDAINSANALSLMVSRDDGLPLEHGALLKKLETDLRHPIINPIYEIHRTRDGIHLNRRIPNQMYAGEYPLTLSHLPRRDVIPGAVAQSMRGRTVEIPDKSSRDEGIFADMLRKFIIIDAPRKYV